ncbi:hypothetical protein PPYR_15515 [Photinus pyralis]|uniref:Uncharacterized protein n=1 Tax=Photinus pyralis TaxID=7054 RepID=A0A1Y1M9B8_PHOPY|nr:hypothetical protein PPYR_15515 [Photinus pyralis]
MNGANDTLQCVIKDTKFEKDVTKRRILSSVAGVFDPMGYLYPVTIPTKSSLPEVFVPRHFQIENASSLQLHVFPEAFQDGNRMLLCSSVTFESKITPVTNEKFQ